MKELTVEQKAIAYDKALQYARIYYKNGNEDMKMMMKTCFPVLVEDSEDERIRKDLLNHLQNAAKGKTLIVNTEDYRRWAVWLEKQGNKDMGISEATKQELGNNLHKALEKETPESLNEFLEKQDEKKEEEIEEWLGCEAFPEGTNITPLPKAMEIVRKTANHFYDFGRKQQAIRNIQCTNSQVITPESYINEGQKKGIQIVLDNPKEYGLQKIAKWSEEDEETLKDIITSMTNLKDSATSDALRYIYNSKIDWLKSLRPQSAWKPSDEQMKILNEVLNFAANHESPHWNDYIFGTLNNLIRQLKKLRKE